MRTSGAEEDLALVAVPLVVLVGLSLFWLGGPRELLQIVDRLVLDSIAWVRQLWM